MTAVSKIVKDQSGSTIIFALLFLVILTIVAISASTTTTIELQIAANDQFHKMAFGNADSGVYASPKLISRTINESEAQDVTGFGFEYRPDSNSDSENKNRIYEQILGYTGHTDEKDLAFADTEVDIEKLRTVHAAGGGTEFASGAEGIGVGSVGGVQIYYGLDSTGSGPRQSSSQVLAEYRKVLGIAGGL